MWQHIFRIHFILMNVSKKYIFIYRIDVFLGRITFVHIYINKYSPNLYPNVKDNMPPTCHKLLIPI